MKKIFVIISAIIGFSVIFSSCARVNESEKFAESDKIVEPEKREITLYFPDEDVMYLEKETREIELEESMEKSVLLELFKGPENKKLHPSIDGDVRILSAKTENGICTVDLSSEFVKYNTGGSTQESMAIMSIVNSLCEIEGVNKVKINIEGEENPEFGGHFTLEEPFSPDGI